MAEKETKINNTQRREFAKLADDILRIQLEASVAEMNSRRMVAIQEAEENLGAADLDEQIEALEDKIQLLQDRKEALGVSRYGHIIEGSKAADWIQEFLRPDNEDIARYKAARSTAKEWLWASQTLEEAKSIMEEVRDM